MRGRGSGSGGGRRGAGELSRARAAAEPPGEGPRGACRECAGNGLAFPGRLSVSQSRSLLLSPRSWLVFFKATTFVVGGCCARARDRQGALRTVCQKSLLILPTWGRGNGKKKKLCSTKSSQSQCCGAGFHALRFDFPGSSAREGVNPNHSSSLNRLQICGAIASGQGLVLPSPSHCPSPRSKARPWQPTQTDNCRAHER